MHGSRSGGAPNRHPSCRPRVWSIACGSSAQPALEKPPLGLLPRERERALVRGAGVRGSPKPPAQLRARGVRKAVVQQVAALRGWRRRGPDPPPGRRASPRRPPGSARSPGKRPLATARRRGRRSPPSPSRRRSAPRRARPRSPPESCTGRTAATPGPARRAVCLPRSDRGPTASDPDRRAGSVRPTARCAPRAATRAAASAPAARSASGSGSNSTSSRPRRIASADRSCRVSDAPDDAA